VWEVIPVKQSKAYRSISVKQVDVEKVLCGRAGSSVEAGLDIGKKWVWVVIRFRDGTYQRPWRVSNPAELSLLAEVLKQIGQRVKLTVAMESSGTYGDALRAALGRADLCVHRVSSKASHDWAESFDGVPSQHDGKDAGVVAELCAMGKSVAWPLRCASAVEQEMGYWVDQLDGAHRVQQVWVGRLESRLSRHWPEACGELKLSSPTLLKALKRWGGPAALGADAEAASTLQRLCRGKLEEGRIDRLVQSARGSMGLAMGEWDQRRMQGDGPEPGGAFQRDAAGRTAHQQAWQVVAAAVPLLRGVALRLPRAGGQTVVRPEEGPRRRGRAAWVGGGDAQAAAGVVVGGPGRSVRRGASVPQHRQRVNGNGNGNGTSKEVKRRVRHPSGITVRRPPSLRGIAPEQSERPTKSRGAADRFLGKISHAADSMARPIVWSARAHPRQQL
jgi:hypothetical protein